MMLAFIFGTVIIVGLFAALLVVKSPATTDIREAHKGSDRSDKDKEGATITTTDEPSPSAPPPSLVSTTTAVPTVSPTPSTSPVSSAPSSSSVLVIFSTVVFLMISVCIWFQGLINIFKTMGEVEGSVFGALVLIAHLLASVLFWLASFAFWLAIVLLSRK